MSADILFFDLDGTLTESKPGIMGALRYAVNSLGLEMPPDEILDNFIGPSLLDSFERYMGLTGEAGQRALEEYRVYYGRQGEFENSVYEGVEQMLGVLKSAGKKLYVVTAKPEPAAKRIIAHFGLDKYFERVFGASLDESRNHKKAVITYALEECGAVNTDGIFMIGDRHDDVNGALSSGIGIVGVLYGYGTEEELMQAGCSLIAKTPGEVADIILGMA